jgi:hypothetical protein
MPCWIFNRGGSATTRFSDLRRCRPVAAHERRVRSCAFLIPLSGPPFKGPEPVRQLYGIDVPGRGWKIMNIESCRSTAVMSPGSPSFRMTPLRRRFAVGAARERPAEMGLGQVRPCSAIVIRPRQNRCAWNLIRQGGPTGGLQPLRKQKKQALRWPSKHREPRPWVTSHTHKDRGTTNLSSVWELSCYRRKKDRANSPPPTGCQRLSRGTPPFRPWMRLD